MGVWVGAGCPFVQGPGRGGSGWGQPEPESRDKVSLQELRACTKSWRVGGGEQGVAQSALPWAGRGPKAQVRELELISC